MRVAFFHPYKMADHYFVEAIETAQIADLCADGHHAEAADYLFDPARSEEEQIAEMRAALVREGYDLVFLERPWSDEMVRALSGLRVAAYARPELVERGLVDLGLIDVSRDAVRALVRALANGEPLTTVPGVVFREGGEVRRTDVAPNLSVLRELGGASFAHGKRRVLSRRGANEQRAVVLANLGCAYRNVPNRTGVFDGVPMPDDVSTAGCTFCDATAYERMTEDQAIALIVRQVAAVLRDRPEVREIAIKDDYAVRFLGRLGDALRPLGLGDREVLLSARAEYLLDLREEIEAALSGGFPTSLGFYLIGFENFSQPELDRFNKGTSAARIEGVLSLMRDWSARFPGRFRVTPTGGFILFTPWTTLEDLRANLGAFRRLGFERYRGQALLSQLRLYPHLPLYWLAKRDGLLVEAFEREEMSDAHRRGYEADHAWRFADPRVAEVQRRVLDMRALSGAELLDAFEDAIDDAAGVPRKPRPVTERASRGAKGPARAISLNRTCNQGCAFCTYRAPRDEAPRARAARAVQAVRAAAKEGARAITLTGAEPLIDWYLPDLVRLARSLGVAEVVLETNATLLADGGPVRAAALAAAGVTRAVVALNAIDPAISDAITRDPGGHARTVAGVRALLAAGIPVEITVALLPENRGALRAIAEQARDLFPTTAASVDTIVARHIAAGERHPRALSIEDALAEIDAATGAGVPIRSMLASAPTVARAPSPEPAAASRPAAPERAAPSPPPPRAPTSVWAEIGLSPSHALSPHAEARVADGALFAPPSQPFFDAWGPADDRELVQLEGGLRDLIKIERSSVASAEETVARMRARGLSASVYASPAPSSRAIAFVGRASGPVEEAMEMEPRLAGSLRDRAPLVGRIGKLLGYPPCCVEAFASSAEQDDATLIARLAHAQAGPLALEQNWAAIPLRPFSHFPCTPTCAETARLSRATLALFRPEHRAKIERALRSVVLLGSAERFALLLDARADGPDAFAYGSVLSHKNLGLEPEILAHPAFRAFHVEVIAPLEEGDRVQRTASTLLVTRAGQRIAAVTFAGLTPPLLDFTAERALRRLAVAQP